MSGEKAAPRRRMKIIVTPQTGKSQGVPSLFTVTTSVSYRVRGSGDEDGEQAGARVGEGSSAQTVLPETRIYKGAVYEKGEDGQWHLQHE